MFNHRSYSGKLFRPKPETFLSDDGKVLIVATPWGAREAARKTIEVVNDYLNSFFRDPEATSPFPKLANFSDSANAVRVAALLANDALFKNENKDEYKVGVELFLAVLNGEEVSYLKLGLPQVMLMRKNKPLLPVSVGFDLSSENTDESALHPLPDEYLGIAQHPHIQVQSFKRQREDQLLLLSHSWIPKSLYQIDPGQTSPDQITRVLANEAPDQPFWVGVWSFA